MESDMNLFSNDKSYIKLVRSNKGKYTYECRVCYDETKIKAEDTFEVLKAIDKLFNDEFGKR